jgi:chromosome segregation ATPase
MTNQVRHLDELHFIIIDVALVIVSFQPFRNRSLTPNLLVKTRIVEWTQAKKGASGLEKRMFKLLAQVTVALTAETVSSSLEQLMQLMEKFDVFIPVLQRKIACSSSEWEGNEVLSGQFREMDRLCEARKDLVCGKLQNISELIVQAERQEQAKLQEVADMEKTKKRQEQELKELQQNLEESKASLVKLQREAQEYATIRRSSSETQARLRKDIQRAEQGGRKRRRQESGEEEQQKGKGKKRLCTSSSGANAASTSISTADENGGTATGEGRCTWKAVILIGAATL